MKYTSPLRNNKPYWIPIVCKNKDYLVGYLNGVGLVEFTLLEAMKSLKIDFDFNNIDLFLDSSRFNDVLEDGRREHTLTEEEKKEMFVKMFKSKLDSMDTEHSENNTEYDDILRLECICGYGYYAWKEFDEIPSEQFTCSECGRVLIDYTGNNDYEYEFDGGEDENSKES